MSLYHKKPERIEAYQVGVDKPPKWVYKAINKDLMRLHNKGQRATILTDNGIVRVNRGDYIVRDEGESVYHMTRAEFEKKYAKVTIDNH